MSLLNRIGAALRGNPLENPATPLSAPAAWLYDLFGGTPTASGVTVNETIAMQQTTIFSIINGIQSDVSSLPLKVYEITDTGKKPAVDTDLYYLLAVEPNPDMTAAAFIGCIAACVALSGNAYAEIQRQGSKPIALWPRHPRFVKPMRARGGEQLGPEGTATKGDLIYEVKDTIPARYVRSADMIHVAGLTMDGWLGISPIEAARQTIGMAIAAERFGAGFFGRGSRPSGLLTPAEAIKPGDVRLQNARDSWEKANSGDNQGRTAVMPAGWTWTKIGLSPEEGQFIQTTNLTRTQLCGLWRYPPHMAGDISRLSNSNHESQALEYVTFTLRPILVRLEQEFERKLVPSKGRTAGKYTVRFDISELIRGDYASIIAAVAMGKQWGIYTTNKALEKLGENPIGPVGDVLYMPLNMVPVGPDGHPAPDPDIAGTDGAANEPAPKGNGGQNQRMLLDRMQLAYGALFRDALGRLAARSKRDGDSVAQICGPVLETMAAEAIRQAITVFRLETNNADLGHEKILRDYRGSLAKRAAEWKKELDETEASAELARAVRAITIGIFREGGSMLVQAG